LKDKPAGKPVYKGEVLLCEDSKINQDIVCDHLAKVGLRTVVAENGAEGVEIFMARAGSGLPPFDLIFMDIQMPVMDGLRAAAEISKTDAHTPIIAMSANGEACDREEYAAHGMCDCLVKPFTSKSLYGCLSKYLTPANAAEKAAAPGHREDADAQFHKKLIQVFYNENKNIYEEITGAARDGDIKTANRLAHNLKGNAGNLGKAGLQHAAQNVENLLADGTDRLTENDLAIFKNELDAVLSEFAPQPGALSAAASPASAFPSAADGPSGSPAADPVIDPKRKRILINKLELMLDSGNPECLELAGELRGLPGSGGMIEQMENFNFDEALETLGELKRKWM
jgi:CheY-like chemotaxis protein